MVQTLHAQSLVEQRDKRRRVFGREETHHLTVREEADQPVVSDHVDRIVPERFGRSDSDVVDDADEDAVEPDARVGEEERPEGGGLVLRQEGREGG